VPLVIARPIAQRLLALRGNAPARGDVTLSGLDMSVRRGSLRTAIGRDGSPHKMMVRGYSIKGANLGQPNFSVTMTLTLQEIS
jgi:hypothetical protein